MSSDYRDYEPIHPRGRDWRGIFRRLFGPLVAGAIALAKFSFVLIKFAGIFISVGLYTLFFGWKFAVGFVLLILLHESGHYIEAKREGLNPKLPVFIPFLGAYVQYTRGNPWQTARVALAGPIVGGLASLVCFLIGQSQRLGPVPRARLHRLLPQPDQHDPGQHSRRRCDLAIGQVPASRRRP